MSSAEPVLDSDVTVPTKYRFLRSLVRLWLRIFFRKVRVLGKGRWQDSAPAVFAIGHPASFRDALILVAAFDRPVRCLISRQLVESPWRRFLASGLEMIPYDPEGEGGESVLDACCEGLERGKAIVVFADIQRTQEGKAEPSGLAAASIAMEAERRQPGELGLSVVPVHLLLPAGRSQDGSLLIHLDAPLDLAEYISPEPTTAPSGLRALAHSLEEAWGENAFRLWPADFEQFLFDLEEILRADLAAEWASRPNWKQDTEGFELSGLVTRCLDQMNYLNTERLVALRELLDEYRERRRVLSLGKFEVESCGAWWDSRVQRTWVWIETVFGFLLACYGVANHLFVWLALRVTGLLKKESLRNPNIEWVLRVLVALACYTVQTLLCARWLGRAAAGYYAPSLPLSGLYAWRYRGLLRGRSRLALLALCEPIRAARLRRLRKRIIDELDRAIQSMPEPLRATTPSSQSG